MPSSLFGGFSLKNAILLMSCLSLSTVRLILLVGRACEMQIFRPNPSRRRVSLQGSWCRCISPCFSTEVGCHQRSSRMSFQFHFSTFQFSFLQYVGGGHVCNLASQVSSLSRALFCIRRVHLRDRRGRCGGRILHGHAPLLGIPHSFSGWSEGGCCHGRVLCRCRCCAWGDSCCDGGHGCGTTLRRASGGSLGGRVLFWERPLWREEFLIDFFFDEGRFSFPSSFVSFEPL